MEKVSNVTTTTTTTTSDNVHKRHSLGPHRGVTQKQIVINRRSGGLGAGGNIRGGSIGHSMSMSMGGSGMGRQGMNLPLGIAGNIAHDGVGNVKAKREVEKKDMQDLNNRLANYIAQVRTLQAENKALQEQLKKKRKEFDPEPMKEIYQQEIDESKKLLEEAQKENAELKITVTSLEDELDDMKATSRLQDERIDQLQDKVNSLNDENSHLTAECDMLRRKVAELEKQVTHWRAKYNEVYSQLQACRADLKDETNLRVMEARTAENLREELDFLKTVTDAEIREYKDMLAKEDHSGSNVRAVFTDELSSCMKELREEYDQRLADISDELSSRYESQLTQIRTNMKPEAAVAVHSTDNRNYRMELSQKDFRIKELEGQIEQMRMELINMNNQLDKVNVDLESERDGRAREVSGLRAEMESMLKELQMIMDAKLSLELEIAAYRKLLEGEENRLSVSGLGEMLGHYRDASADALANILSSGGGGGGSGMGMGMGMGGGGGGGGGGSGMGMGGGGASGAGGDSGRITMQRTSKGNMSIAECDNQGRFIMLENTSASRQNTPVSLKGWKLERKVNATGISPEKIIDFTFTENITLAGEQYLKVWAKTFENESNRKAGDIVSTVENWGPVNQTSMITLYDAQQNPKATMSIKAMF